MAACYGGHSIGHWEDDTLVIDTVGFNERIWIDARGAPTTKDLDLVERITRLDFNRLAYEMIVDAPGAYTATWKTGMLMNWTLCAQPTSSCLRYCHCQACAARSRGIQLRFPFARYPQIMGKALAIVCRTIATHLLHSAGFGNDTARTGTVARTTNKATIR